MKKIKYFLIGLSLLIITACSSTSTEGGGGIHVSRWNPFRLLPGISSHGAPIITEQHESNYAWMYHLAAIIAIGFAAVSSWISGGLSKSSKTLLAIGGGISLWAIIMPALAKAVNMYAPWVVGALFVFGLAEVGLRFYNKYFKKK